ncbi:MAG: TonB-dependent receptor, partial [Saprospiraceae bacterium]
MKRVIFCLLSMLICTSGAWAQYSISGKVTDEAGGALSGAIMRIDGTNMGTVTDDNGDYTLSVADKGSYTISTSYVGYVAAKQTVEVKSMGVTGLNFLLNADAIGLSDVVVTGVMNPKSKMESSVSISTMNAQAIESTVARGTAEVLRSIPGIRSEASGGDGNTNITVRGVPISAGGSKYLQLQEDGLPVLLFGDIAFATQDIFLRVDNSINRIEAIRGGSASTLATNSPAGIINFISNTGAVQSSSVGTTFGLDHNSFRTDFSMGTPLSEDISFHVGGFVRQGEGVRTAGFTANNGAQIKANLTKRFNNGHVRLYYKYLNDRTAAYMPMPIQVSGTNSSPKWESVNGFDAKSGTIHTPYLSQNLGLGGDGSSRLVNVADGMHPVSNAVGTEFMFELGNGFRVENRNRFAFNHGRFLAPFPAEIGTGTNLANSVAALLGDTTNTASLQYTDGTAFNNSNQALRIHMFDTELRNFNNLVNDLKVTKSFGIATINLGYFVAQQNVQMSWLWNSYLQEMKGENARLLNVVDAGGNVLSQNGLYAYGVPAWGNCCQRGYDAHYSIKAPYAGVELAVNDNLNIDASLRWDSGKVTGSYAGTSQSTLDVHHDGVISATEQSVSAINNANSSPINYTYNYMSYSLGANFKLNENNALFARYSRGGAAKADRILFTSNVLSDGDAKGVVDYV